MLKCNTDRTVGAECRVDVLCMYVYGDTMQAEVLLCLLVPQPTDTTAPQPATVIYTNPQDSISSLTRHFSGIHFNIILQCMRISSKLHITLRCSGQNVRLPISQCMLHNAPITSFSHLHQQKCYLCVKITNCRALVF
jgi:hypothetical protein